MSASWEPPRCGHGRILLACPDDECPEQNAYLRAQDIALEAWQKRERDAAREIVRDVLGLDS